MQSSVHIYVSPEYAVEAFSISYQADFRVLPHHFIQDLPRGST